LGWGVLLLLAMLLLLNDALLPAGVLDALPAANA